MCGLVAIVARRGQPLPLRSLESAVSALVHRGPDDAGVHVHENIGLGFRRLSILDLSAAGHQPMPSPDARYTLVFNGEIYNYLELRDELARLGHVFRSHSDSEVLLAAYRQWGSDCVTRFNGMWAFVIHDRDTGTLFGARDRLGVKPLYVCETAGHLVIASEPRAIGATGLHAMAPDMLRLATAIRWHRMDHDAGCCLQGIRQVPAGHRFVVDANGRFRSEPYWGLPAARSAGDSIPAQRWVDELAALLIDAVRLRLRSDVPVGFTLSGGIDSSLLICEAARLRSHDAELLAFSYHDDHYDERDAVAATVEQTRARLVVQESSRLDVATLLPEVVRANGEPVHSLSAVANYALFRLARANGVKVLLGGQGADEVFGGYSSFQWDRWHGLFEDRRWRALADDVRAFSRLNERQALGVLAQTLWRSVRIGLAGSSALSALRPARAVAARSHPIHQAFAPHFLMSVASEAGAAPPTRLPQAQHRALNWWPLPMYLRIEDRVSMAHGVEARLPFMDYRLVEHALRMPEELKFSGGLNKVGLRRIAAGRVPQAVTNRLFKYGFPVGDTTHVAAQLQKLLAPLASSAAFRGREIYDHAAVRELLAGPPDGTHVDTLLYVAQTELWLSGLEGGSMAAS